MAILAILSAQNRPNGHLGGPLGHHCKASRLGPGPVQPEGLRTAQMAIWEALGAHMARGAPRAPLNPYIQGLPGPPRGLLSAPERSEWPFGHFWEPRMAIWAIWALSIGV